MTDRNNFPKGYGFESARGFDDTRPWTIRFNNALLFCGIAPDHETARKMALARAWEHWDRENLAPAAQETSAWMVEVAREGGALGFPALERFYRNGDRDGSDISRAVIVALRLAIERGHVVEPRPMPNEEDLLKAAREDAAQAYRDDRMPIYEAEARSGKRDAALSVRAALQARRNVLSEIRAVAPVAVPEVDLDALANAAWSDGWTSAAGALHEMHHGQGNATTLCVRQRSRNVSDLLSTLSVKE